MNNRGHKEKKTTAATVGSDSLVHVVDLGVENWQRDQMVQLLVFLHVRLIHLDQPYNLCPMQIIHYIYTFYKRKSNCFLTGASNKPKIFVGIYFSTNIKAPASYLYSLKKDSAIL